MWVAADGGVVMERVVNPSEIGVTESVADVDELEEPEDILS